MNYVLIAYIIRNSDNQQMNKLYFVDYIKLLDDEKTMIIKTKYEIRRLLCYRYKVILMLVEKEKILNGEI